jgi:putative chitinase
MRKQFFLVTIFTIVHLCAFSQKQSALVFRHIFIVENKQSKIQHFLRVIQNVTIPLKIKGNSFVASKKLRSATTVLEIVDTKSELIPKHFKGNMTAAMSKCFFTSNIEIKGDFENNKALKINVKQSNKTIDIDFKGEKWSATFEDDNQYVDLGILPFKNKATLSRKGREEQFFVTLKVTDLTKKNKQKKLKTHQICPITYDVLVNVLPNMKENIAEQYAAPLSEAMAEFGINTPARVNMFLAQVSHESDNFRIFKEEGKPALFARYDRIRGLGNTQHGDGFRFRGRGPIQITGRKNYREVGEALGIDLENNPDLLEDSYYAFRAAAWWWQKHGLNEKMDKYPNNVKVATKIINGGYRHLKRRQSKYNYIASSMDMLAC